MILVISGGTAGWLSGVGGPPEAAGYAARGLLPFDLPMPGEKFVQPGLRHLGDAIEDVGEPGLGVDAVELRGADQGVHHRRPLAAAIGAREEPRFTSVLLSPQIGCRSAW